MTSKPLISTSKSQGQGLIIFHLKAISANTALAWASVYIGLKVGVPSLAIEDFDERRPSGEHDTLEVKEPALESHDNKKSVAAAGKIPSHGSEVSSIPFLVVTHRPSSIEIHIQSSTLPPWIVLDWTVNLNT
ncbi:hypothetical protein QQP08_003419 [Theobroma cacao]|nr:hypothetical protein QQP08_003419 [Theobroma cacao]